MEGQGSCSGGRSGSLEGSVADRTVVGMKTIGGNHVNNKSLIYLYRAVIVVFLKALLIHIISFDIH